MPASIVSLVNSALSVFGVRIAKANPRPHRSNNGITQRVGTYDLLMPSAGNIAKVYATNIEYSSEIARLVEITRSKYSDLKVIDIGANVGDTVAVIKSLVDVPIVAIEGDADTLIFLEKNVHLFNNVEIIKTFLDEVRKTISVSISKIGWNTTLVPTDENAKPNVPVETLDNILAERSDRSCFKFIKIDTEGFDCRILRGSQEVLSDVKPVVHFEYNREAMNSINESGVRTFNSMRELGYRKIVIWDNQGRFLLASDLGQQEILSDLDAYVSNGSKSAIAYWDVCIFHSEDDDIASKAIAVERSHILNAL